MCIDVASFCLVANLTLDNKQNKLCQIPDLHNTCKFLFNFERMGHGIRHKKNKQQNNARGPRPDGGYKDIVRENDWFEAFYRSQEGLCPPHEFNEMITVMKRDLPASFRITGTRSFCKFKKNVKAL